jgi:hypothetical protein
MNEPARAGATRFGPYTARRSFAVAALTQALVLTASPCLAQSEDEAALAHGVQLRRELRDAEALAEFQRSYSIRPTPKARAQIALAEQALGRWVTAEKDLTEALGHGEDAWITSNRGALEAAGAEIARHIGTLEVVTNVAGATLRVDGVPSGTAPQTLRLGAGTVVVEVEAPGFELARRRIEVFAGAVEREPIVLVAIRPPAPPPAAVEAHVVDPAPAPPPRPEASGPPPVWMWVSFGGAAAALGTGVTASVVREQHAARWNDDATCPQGSKAALCGGDRDAVNQATVVAVAGYAAAAAFTAAGVYLALSRRRGPTVSSWVAPGTIGANVGVGF